MGSINAFGVALKIVESGKYKNNKAVCAIVGGLKSSLSTLDVHVAASVMPKEYGILAPLEGYVKGARGEDGYSTWLDVKDVTRAM